MVEGAADLGDIGLSGALEVRMLFSRELVDLKVSSVSLTIEVGGDSIEGEGG